MLTFHLKKIWFEKIKSGEKTHEYRIVNKYWYQRLKDIPTKLYYDEENKMDENILKCCFVCGYPPSNNMEKRLFAKITRFSIHNGLNTDLKIDKPVYDIEFELRKD